MPSFFNQGSDKISAQENLLKVIHRETGEELFSFPLEEREQAFQFAQQVESYGIDVDLVGPNSVESLGNCLGLDSIQAQHLKDSLVEEIEEH